MNTLSQYLKEHLYGCQDEGIGDPAYTLSERHSNLPWKAAFAAHSLSQLAKALSNETLSSVCFTYNICPVGRSRQSLSPSISSVSDLGFVFTGQRSQRYTKG